MSDTTNDCTASRDAVITTRMREDDSDGGERDDRRLPGEPPRQHEAAPRTNDTAMAPSASERISKLLEELRPQRKALLAIIDFCREERSSSQIDEMLAPLLVWRQSVYTNVNLRSMLESAGALTWHANDDAPEYELDECGALVIPSAVNDVVGTWTATPAGIAALEAADPFGELVNALEQDAFKHQRVRAHSAAVRRQCPIDHGYQCSDGRQCARRRRSRRQTRGCRGDRVARRLGHNRPWHALP